jgi:hypothetical protein
MGDTTAEEQIFEVNVEEMREYKVRSRLGLDFK